MINLKVGSRASPLAQAQTQIVLNALKLSYPNDPFVQDIDVKLITTTGDKIKDHPLTDKGGKALFAKEIQQALLKKEIDFAVHSLKDLEHTSPAGLIVTAVLEREDCRDVLITPSNSQLHSLLDLKLGAVIGTCSPRRAAQLLHLRPDLNIVPLRGNVQTRLQKLEVEKLDAIILALAGLKRLGLWQKDNDQLKGYPQFRVEILSLDQILPAAGQGILAIECREDNENIKNILKIINHSDTYQCLLAERSLLNKIGGNCYTAIAALATKISPETLQLKAAYFPDYPDQLSGRRLFSCHTADLNSPKDLGKKVAIYFK
jgi:hydroxymethylbilane synthase